MRILADECINGSLVRRLRETGHDVTWVCEGPTSSPDGDVLALANSDNRILLTEDHDFGTLSIAQQRPARGIIIAEFQNFPGASSAIVDALCRSIADLDGQVEGWLTVIEPGRIRQRALPRIFP